MFLSVDSRETIELARTECIELLARTHIGRVALSMPDGTPVIRPVNYVFDQASQSVVFRTALGSKLHALLHARQAAFEIDSLDHESQTGWSVILVGLPEPVTNPAERRRLESEAVEPWAAGKKPHWVRIRATVLSGRRIVKAAGAVPQ